MRLLLVEDDPLLGDGIKEGLIDAGFVVDWLTDGESAQRALLTEKTFDAVLLDIGLPGLDGFEVAKRMRRQPPAQKAVLVAMTGNGKESDRQRSQEAGFNHYLVKPAKFETVQEILASVSERAT